RVPAEAPGISVRLSRPAVWGRSATVFSVRARSVLPRLPHAVKKTPLIAMARQLRNKVVWYFIPIERLPPDFVSPWRKQVFQPVESDFVHRSQQHADVSLWKSFLVKPNQVCFGKVTDECVFIFAEWHLGGYQLLHGFFGCHKKVLIVNLAMADVIAN